MGTAQWAREEKPAVSLRVDSTRRFHMQHIPKTHSQGPEKSRSAQSAADERMLESRCSWRTRALLGACSHLLHAQLPLSSCVRGRVTLLLQVNLHKLINGELTGGSVFKFCEPKTGKQKSMPWHHHCLHTCKALEILQGRPSSTRPTA